MAVQISAASTFNATNMHGATVGQQCEPPDTKHFKSDLTFHCIVCSDVYNDPNVLYEHLKVRHPELYERDHNSQDNDDVYDIDDESSDEKNGPTETNEHDASDTDMDFIDEHYSDLCNILEPICELRQFDDDDDEVVENGHSIQSGITLNGTIPQLNFTNEHQLRLQLQLQLQLQNQLLQQTQLASMNGGAVPTQLNGNAQVKQDTVPSKPLTLPPGPGRGRRRELPPDTDERAAPGACVFQCTQCDKSFIFSGDLAKHVRSHTRNKPFQCKICLKAFTHIGSLNTHIRIHSGEKPYKCTTCSKAFTQSSSLMVHMRSHATRKPHQCDVCDKGFVNSSSLILHMRSHTEGDPFPCTECDKRFKSSTLLGEHMLLHSETSLYQCSICRDSFAQSSQLVQHMKNHTGEKPFACSLCDKHFTQPGSLNTHMRIHTGERPFACKQCDKSFTQASSLSVHMKVHANESSAEKQYRCTVCNKSYSQQSYLNKHMLFHTGEPIQPMQPMQPVRPIHPCKWCNKPFSDPMQLIYHIVTEHDLSNNNAGAQNLACLICRQVFNNAPTLIFHLRDHFENGLKQ